jgi:hypothetical protein
VAPVQTAYADSGSAAVASQSVTFTAAATGNTLVVIANSDATLTGPAGYTQILGIVSTQGFYAWYKKAAGGETSATVTPSVSRPVAVGMFELTGELVPDVTAYNSGGAVTTLSTNGTLPPSTSGTVLVAMAAHNFSTAFSALTWTNATARRAGGTTYATASQNVGIAIGDFTSTTTTAAVTDTATWTTAPGDVITAVIVMHSPPTGITRTGWGTGTPSGFTFASDASSLSLGVAFMVTQSNYYLNKIRFYWPSGTGAGAAMSVGLYDTTSGAPTGSVLTGTAGTFTPGANSWAEYTLASPYALTANHLYYAEVWTPGSNGGYGAMAFVYSASDLTAGPLKFPQSSVGGVFNNGYNYGASIAPVSGEFHAAWYGVDVEVGTQATTYTQAVTTSSGTTATITKQAQLPRAIGSATVIAKILGAGKNVTVTSPTAVTMATPRNVLSTIVAASATAVSQVLHTAKALAISSPAVFTVAKALTTTKTLTSPVVFTALKQVNLTRSSTVTATVTVVSKAVSLIRTITSPLIVTPVLMANKLLTFGSATTATLTTFKLRIQSVVASVTTAASLIRSTLLPRLIASSLSVSAVKGVQKSYSLNVGSTMTSVRSMLLTRTQTLATTASVAVHSAQTLVIKVTSATVARVTRQVNKVTTLTSATAASFLTLVRRFAARRGWGQFI